jgi:hypothetical protein
LGLPCNLLVRSFQLNIFLTVLLVSGILCTWPNQLSLWVSMWLIIFLCFISLSNSSLVLTPHIWFSFVGPNILLKIFLSKTNNYGLIPDGFKPKTFNKKKKSTPLERVFWDATVPQCIKKNTSLSLVRRSSNPF